MEKAGSVFFIDTRSSRSVGNSPVVVPSVVRCVVFSPYKDLFLTSAG